MAHLILHLLRTASSDGVPSQILAIQGGLVVTYLVWRRLVRRITRILSTATVLGVAAFLFAHPVDFTHSVDVIPTCAPFCNQP